MCGLTEAILLGNFSSSLTNYLRGKGGPVQVSLQGCLRPTRSGFQGSAQPIMRGHLSQSCDWGISELWAHRQAILAPCLGFLFSRVMLHSAFSSARLSLRDGP